MAPNPCDPEGALPVITKSTWSGRTGCSQWDTMVWVTANSVVFTSVLKDLALLASPRGKAQ